MIVAGSVLALLLMGLAVDGFVNPIDDEDDDNGPELEGAEDLSDQSGEGDALTDLLSANDPAAGSEPLSYTPFDEVATETEEEAALAAEEGRVEDEWAQEESAREFVDVNAVTEMENGEDVAYVEAFDTTTDTLVLEFEGTAADAPEIDVEFDAEEDAAIVQANGIPVTLVEGAEDMTVDHIRIVMTGEETALQPQVLPSAEGIVDPLFDETGEEAVARDQGALGPQTLSLPDVSEPTLDEKALLHDPANDEAQTLPLLEDIEPTAFEDLLPRDLGSDGPLTLTHAEGLDPTEVDLTEVDLTEGLDPLESADQTISETPQTRDTGIEGPQTQLTPEDIVLPVEETLDVVDPLPELPLVDVEDAVDVVETIVDPVTDVVDTITDGLPGIEAINAILDQVTDGMTGIGGIDEMLDARTEMDDAFGTGGEDALTGTFNDDMVTGGSGQDALFGDEGNDTLQAGAGNDELHGDFGNDQLDGGTGFDFLDGGEGDDTLDGGGDRDLLFGGEGDDVLYGGAADDFLSGGMGADMLNGGSGNDVLDGTFGTDGYDKDDGDVLWGGTGDDTLILGQGDIAHGGAGADTFLSGSYVENAEVAGRVEDFDPGEDRIEVIFDPSENPDPMLEVQDFADGTGADIILNGEVILSVAGAQGLDPNMIELQAIA